MARELGDKVGPRLSRLIVGHTLAVRSSLAPIEAKIAAAGTQQVIDRMGLEVGAHNRELITQLVQADPAMPDWLKQYLGDTASGEHQWQAIAGQLALSTGTGTLGEILSNELAPAVYALVGANPHLIVPVETIAQAAAARLVTPADAYGHAAQLGYGPAQVDVLVNLANAIPGGPTLYDLHNRGLIRAQDLRYWLTRAAIPQSLIGPIAELATQVLAPADAALAVLRGNLGLADGYRVAAANGVTNADFDILIGNTGEPLALEEMLLLWRWEKMDTATLEKGIRQSRVRDEWIPFAKELGIVPPSGAEIIDALVRGQIPHGEAVKRWKIAGGDPTWFDTAVSSNARPPSPGQLAEMAHRGIIPWDGTGPAALSFKQGIYEGDTKNKWEPAFRELAAYLPPPREVSTLVKEGGITQDEALSLWEQHGLSPELAHIYWRAAHYQKTARVHELAQGEIVTLYTDMAISREEAKAMLESVNWTAADAEWLLDIADLRRERQALEGAIAKIRGLFVAWKIDKTTATAALAALSVPASQAQHLAKTWELERGANVKVLTAAEITAAWFYKLIGPEEAISDLEAIGYTRYDAWLVLSIKSKGPVEGVPKPSRGR